MRELFRCRSGFLEPEKIADARGRRNQQREPRSIRSGAISHDCLITGRDVTLFAGGRVKHADVSSTLATVNGVNTFSVFAPNRWSAAAAPGRGVVAADARTNIPVKAFS